MKPLDITPEQAHRIGRVADCWCANKVLPDWAGSYGETFGEWLAGYLDSLAPEPAPPNLADLDRAMCKADEEYDRISRRVGRFTDEVKIAHTELIRARVALANARAMADAQTRVVADPEQAKTIDDLTRKLCYALELMEEYPPHALPAELDEWWHEHKPNQQNLPKDTTP